MWPLALTAALVLVASGCQPTPPPPPGNQPVRAATCEELADQIVDSVQEYVDSFAEVSAGEISGAVSARQDAFAATTIRLRERGTALGCSPDELAGLVRDRLGRLTGGTPVQDAVAATFRADPLGGVDPSDPKPVEVTVETAEQLAAAVATVGSGSTVRLAAGTFELSTPLVALRPITLVGAGDGSGPGIGSTITSDAAGAVLIAATSGDLVMSDLALEHEGESGASIVVVAGGGYRFDRIRLSGATSQNGDGGYGIVLRPSSNPLTPTGSSRSLTDVTLTDNEEGGVVIAGEERPAIARATVSGSAGCGLCWVERAAGTASDSSVRDTQIGVRIDDDASPVIERVRVEGAAAGVALTGSGHPRVEDSTLSKTTIGVQATGAGAGVLSRNRVEDAKEIGFRLSGTTRMTLEDNRISGPTKIGVATVDKAHSVIRGGRIASTGDVGLVWGDNATGSASQTVIRGPGLGVQLVASAAVDLTDVVADRVSAASVLASGDASGTISGLSCGGGDAGIVVLTGPTTVRVKDSPTCREYRK